MTLKILSLFVAVSMTATNLHAEEGVEESKVKKDPKLPVYNLVVSDGAGPNDLDVFISRKVGKVLSFKYCPARTQDGKATVAAAVRGFRFAEPERLKKVEILRQIFEDPSCRIVGAPAYGWVRQIAYMGSSPDPGHFYRYFTLQGFAAMIAGFVSVYNTFEFSADYRTFKTYNNAASFRGALSEMKSSTLKLAILGAVVSAGIIGNLYYADSIQEKLETYEVILNTSFESNEETVFMTTQLSMDEFLSHFKLGLETAVKQQSLLAL